MIEKLSIRLADANGLPVQIEQVGWCWPDETYPSITHFFPFDNAPPPPRVGIQPVFVLTRNFGLNDA